MIIPKFKTIMEQAQFRVNIKRELRRAGLTHFDNDLPTETLIDLKNLIVKNG